jgi:hypothetical protein
MPIYEYETIPENPNVTPFRFEWRQSMADPVLERHPETGEVVRRVYAAFHVGAAPARPAARPAAQSGCGCCQGEGAGACPWG